MTLTRRRLIAGSALSTTVVGVSGCLGRAGDALGLSSQRPRVTFSGNVDSEEPPVERTDVSTDDSYPNHYSKLITTQEAEAREIRWEYIERELPGLVDDLEGTDFDSEFLVFFGLVLPRTKQLQPGGPTTIENGTLHAEYHVEPDPSGSTEIVVNTALQRVIHDDPPEDVEVSVRF